jgi:ribosomal protein S18 acetylase RimI-like enzyme
VDNPARFTLRPFVIADYDAVFALWLRSEGMGLGDGDTREGIAKFLDRNPGLSRVAEAEERIVGAVMCGHDGRRGYLHHLAVDANFQKRGIGRALVEACLAALKAEAIPRCSVFVYANNHAGRAFWGHFGWRLRDDIVIIQKVFSAENG